MSFAREGFGAMALSGMVAVAGFACAVWRRSWALWILAMALLCVAIWVAWSFRVMARAGERVSGNAGTQVAHVVASAQPVRVARVERSA
jgi:hypothetical protein